MHYNLPTQSLDLTQFFNTLNWVGCTVIAAMGLAALCAGILIQRRWTVRAKSISFYRHRWSLHPSIDDDLIRIAIHALRSIRAWSLILTGSGIALWAAFWILVAWFSEGRILIASILNGSGFTVAVIMPVCILGCAGHAYGVHRMRTRAKNHPAHGDLLPRRMRDYVPVRVPTIFTAWMSLLIVLTVAAWMFSDLPLRINLNPDQWVNLPYGHCGLLAIPLFTALFLLLGVGELRWMAKLPRLKSLEEFPGVEVFDAHFRRESIHSVLQQYSSLLFFSIMVQLMFILYNMPRISAMIFLFFAGMILNVVLSLWMVFLLYFNRAALPVQHGHSQATP